MVGECYVPDSLMELANQCHNDDYMDVEDVDELVNILEASYELSKLMKRWQDFAKHLNISTTEITRLENGLRDGVFKANEVLRILLTLWTTNYSHGSTRKIICDALANCDLHHLATAVFNYNTNKEKSTKFRIDGKVVSLDQLLSKYGAKHSQTISHETSHQNQVNVAYERLGKHKIAKSISYLESGPIEPDVHKEISLLASALENTPDFLEFLQKWKCFSRFLSINEKKILQLENSLQAKRFELQQIPRKILEIWRNSFTSNATFKTFYDALKETGPSGIEKTAKSNFLQGLVRHSVLPPKKSRYYVERTLCIRTELDPGIFLSDLTKRHIFVFRGIDKIELARAIGYKSVDVSGRQREYLSVQFILLECEEDLPIIYQHASTKTLHLVEFRNNGFHWLYSSQELHIVKRFLKYVGEYVNEVQIPSRVGSLNPNIIFVSDSDGFGTKSFLTSLASNIEVSRPNAILLLASFDEVVQHTKRTVNSKLAFIEAISAFASTSKTAKKVLQKMLKNELYEFQFLFYGYEKIDADKLELADSLLAHAKQLKGVKIILVTTPDFEQRAEGIFNNLTVKILPFTTSNQVDFLTNYWINYHQATNGEAIKQFAQQCLKILDLNMTENEKQFADITVQCMVLADAYAEDVQKASALKTPEDDAIEFVSFFEMFKMFVILRFCTIPEVHINSVQSETSGPSLWKTYTDVHVYDAVAMLFPNHIKYFEHLNKWSAINRSKVFSVGLIQLDFLSNKRKFLHRTIADYFLAKYIVDNLKLKSCAELLFIEVFGSNGVHVERSAQRPPTITSLKYPGLAYFIDMHMKDYVDSKGTSMILTESDFTTARLGINDICFALHVTVDKNYEHCFDLLASTSLALDKKFDVGKNDLIKYLPLIAVKQAKGIVMLQKVLDFTELSGLHLSDHVYRPKRPSSYPWVPESTPVHVAVFRGKYSIFEYLLKRYLDKRLSFNTDHLLHLCVHNTSNIDSSSVADRLLIMDTLLESYPELKEHHGSNHPPILATNVHLMLAKKLVQYGANINAHTYEKGTLLHTVFDEANFWNYVLWAFETGFNQINQKDKNGRTPLVHAIQTFGKLNTKTLQLLQTHGADFNATDNIGDSVLFYTLTYTDSVNFIRKVLNGGADVNHINQNKENAVHMVVQRFATIQQNNEKVSNIDKAQLSRRNSHRGFEDHNHSDGFIRSTVKLLKSRNCNGFNQKDKSGLTPLQKAELLNCFNDEQLDILRSRRTSAHLIAKYLPSTLILIWLSCIIVFFVKKVTTDVQKNYPIK